MFAVRCLAGWNLSLGQMAVVEAEQADVRGKFAKKEADVAFVWAPFNYLVENDKEKAKSLPCLNTDSLDVPALIVARTASRKRPSKACGKS
jgi:hypothetical protein